MNLLDQVLQLQGIKGPIKHNSLLYAAVSSFHRQLHNLFPGVGLIIVGSAAFHHHYPDQKTIPMDLGDIDMVLVYNQDMVNCLFDQMVKADIGQVISPTQRLLKLGMVELLVDLDQRRLKRQFNHSIPMPGSNIRFMSKWSLRNFYHDRQLPKDLAKLEVIGTQYRQKPERP